MNQFPLLKALWGFVGFLDESYARKRQIHENVEIIKDLFYTTSSLKNQSFDLALPKDSQGKLPVIVHIHGGGWVYGHKDSVYQLYGSEMASKGFAVLTINYRLAPSASMKEMVQDVSNAVDIIDQLKHQYPLDETQVFCVGDSAGAQLASLATSIRYYNELQVHYEVTPKIMIQGCMLSCGVYDFQHFMDTIPFPRKQDTMKAIFHTKNFTNPSTFYYASPIHWIHHKFPKMFIVSTEFDALHSQSLRYIDALQDKSIQIETQLYPKKDRLPHVFNTKMAFRQSEEILSRMTDCFLKKV